MTQFIINLMQKTINGQIWFQMHFLKFISIFLRSVKYLTFYLLKFLSIRFSSMFYTFYC